MIAWWKAPSGRRRPTRSPSHPAGRASPWSSWWCGITLPFSYSQAAGQGTAVTVTVLVALFVCLIPTTIGGLLSAIGIAGMDRLIQANVMAMSGRAVEAAGDVDVLLLDKTGTITLGNRQAVSLFRRRDRSCARRTCARCAAGFAGRRNAGGRSIVVLAKRAVRPAQALSHAGRDFIPFTAQTRMSGVDLNGDGGSARARQDTMRKLVRERPADSPAERCAAEVKRIARTGGTPLVVADNAGPSA
jgi:K+-transporting ATPase ATPase B chain